jgi:ABC-2 type transport system ATP-binding protein
MTTGADALLVRDLSKTYRVGFRGRRVRALDGLDLKVERGSIYGFVGPNGAGKSTTIRMLVGLAAPDRGEASIFGRSIRDPAARDAVGYLPENPSFHDFLRPLEALEYLGRLSGLRGAALRKRSEELLELVGLAEARDLTVRKFSKGMVQRLGLAQALVHDPPLLVLDEPMSGLDPLGRKDVRDLVVDLRRRGKTIFFSTHILSDVETICDRVGMLLRGRLVAEGPLAALLDGSIRSVELRCAGLSPALYESLRAAAFSGHGGPEEATLAFPGLEAANQAAARVLAAGGRVLSLQPVRETLEQTFVRLAAGGEAARHGPGEGHGSPSA